MNDTPDVLVFDTDPAAQEPQPQAPVTREDILQRLQQLRVARWWADAVKRRQISQPQRDKKKRKNRTKSKIAAASRKRNR